MGNVRALSFARTTHHEATKSPSMTACAGTRECKEPSAPGEVPVKTLSDGGSTPPTSTIGPSMKILGPLTLPKILVFLGFFRFSPIYYFRMRGSHLEGRV